MKLNNYETIDFQFMLNLIFDENNIWANIDNNKRIKHRNQSEINVTKLEELLEFFEARYNIDNVGVYTIDNYSEFKDNVVSFVESRITDSKLIWVVKTLSVSFEQGFINTISIDACKFENEIEARLFYLAKQDTAIELTQILDLSLRIEIL